MFSRDAAEGDIKTFLPEAEAEWLSEMTLLSIAIHVSSTRPSAHLSNRWSRYVEAEPCGLGALDLAHGSCHY